MKRPLTIARAKALLKRLVNRSVNLDWKPAPSIEQQLFSFRYSGRTFHVGADHTTPLYETIAELVDFDAYHLKPFLILPEGDRVVLDIGGNIGVSSMLLSAIPGARVTAFEPVTGNCERFRRNMEWNNIRNVELIQAGVAARSGEQLFIPTPSVSVGGHLCTDHAIPPPGSFKISTFTLEAVLDRLGAAEIFLIKMDCEGGEHDILDRLAPDLAARIKHITLEVHDLDGSRNIRTLAANLRKAGYELIHTPDLYKRHNLHHILASRP